MFALSACGAVNHRRPLEVVDYADLERYRRLWVEVARTFNGFQLGCSNLLDGTSPAPLPYGTKPHSLPPDKAISCLPNPQGWSFMPSATP